MAASALRIAALCPDALSILEGPPRYGRKVWDKGSGGALFQYSADGALCVLCNQERIEVMRTSDYSCTACCAAGAPVQLAAFSPQGTYLTTLEKTVRSSDTQHHNLKVWATADGRLVAGFSKKGVNEDSWPAIQFDADETHLFFTIKDAVAGYAMDGTFTKSDVKVPITGVSHFALCPSRRIIASFTPENKGGKPALLAVVTWEGEILNRKQFFRAQRARLLWNSTGSHVLCQSICDFDATNQSYFGESRLYLVSADGQLDMAVTMEKDSVVHDVAWSPDGSHFVAVGGINPATAVLFDRKGKAVYKLGTGAYNQVQWSPLGRFVMLAGFGNLPGDIQLFDKKTDGACKAMGACRSACSVTAAWSPCGRYFMTACTAPRMRVDNRITVFTYFGEQVASEEYAELLNAAWQPAPPGTFPDRPQSPERLKDVAQSRKAGVNKTVAAKPTGYVPPHMRGRAGRPRVEGLDDDLGNVRISDSAAQQRGAPVEGAEGLSKAASRNARKRANKAARSKTVEGAPGAPGAVGVQVTDVAQARHEQNGADVEAGGGSQAVPPDPAKRLRNLRKKLAKVEAAKEKKEKGEELTPEQEASLAGEEAIRIEMRSLGATDV